MQKFYYLASALGKFWLICEDLVFLDCLSMPKFTLKLMFYWYNSSELLQHFKKKVVKRYGIWYFTIIPTQTWIHLNETKKFIPLRIINEILSLISGHLYCSAVTDNCIFLTKIKVNGSATEWKTCKKWHNNTLNELFKQL